MMRRSPRDGGGTSPESPIEMSSLGEPSMSDPFRVDTEADNRDRPVSGVRGRGSRAGGPGGPGLYPEVTTTTASPYAGPLYPPPSYDEPDGPVSGHAQPKRPAYIADTPEELHGGRVPPSRHHQTRYSSDHPWHTEQSTTIVVNQPQPQMIMSVRPGPVEMIHSAEPLPTKCFNCERQIITYIYHESGTCTWLACIGLAVLGLDCGCCLLPFFMSTCKDSIHKCPECHVVIGKHRKIC